MSVLLLKGVKEVVFFGSVVLLKDIVDVVLSGSVLLIVDVVLIVLSGNVLTILEEDVIEVVLSGSVLLILIEDVVVIEGVVIEESKELPEVGIENEVEKIVKISDSITVLEAPLNVDNVVIVAVGIRHPGVVSKSYIIISGSAVP